MSGNMSAQLFVPLMLKNVIGNIEYFLKTDIIVYVCYLGNG